MDKKVGARIVSNAGILIATQVVTKLFGTIFTIAVARKLGVEDFGFYVFAVTFGDIFGLVATFGLPQFITREVAREIGNTGEILGSILILEAVLSTLMAVAMVGALLLLRYPVHRIWIVSIAGSAMILNAVLNVIAAFFRAHQRMALEAVMRISLSVLNMSLGLAVLFAGYGVLELAITQLVVFTCVLSLGLLLTVRELARPSLSVDWHAYQKLLGMAVPFALSSIFILVYNGTAVIFLSFIKGDQVTGLYSGAMNFIRIFGLLPASLVGAVLPAMAQFWHTSPNAWRTIYSRSLKYLLIMALPIAVGLAMLSDEFVLFILGYEYADSALILRMIAWVIILAFLNHGFSNALVSIDQEKTYLRIVGVAMVFNVGANLGLIPIWGACGAVAASLLTEGLMLFIQFYVLSTAGLKLSVPAITLKPILSVAVMALGVYLASGLGPVPVILLGAAIYPLALFILRTFDEDEILLMTDLVQSGLAKLGFQRIAQRPHP